jgi:glycosyltransferase involved in cell wall biosynthesis
MTSSRRRGFRGADRPEVALISNHGYAGAEIPLGGAPDTGGQNMYVNSLARALDSLGYRVTVFARGGFAHFASDRVRAEPEYLSDHVRYIYVPGGGPEFIRKEDIAVALDEEVSWLDSFVRREAEERGCHPWEVYELVNTHYWDAAALGVRLVERWRDDIAAEVIGRIVAGCVAGGLVDELTRERHWRAIGTAPAYHLGSILIENEGAPATPIIQRVETAAGKWAAANPPSGGADAESAVAAVADALSAVREIMAPALHALVAAEALGNAVLGMSSAAAERLRRGLAAAERHVWTPHSLAALKEENLRGRSAEVIRALKFCERRDHERAICDRTAMFAATSTEIAERLRTGYGVPTERIFYFPPCVDRAVFRQHTAEEKVAAYAYLSGVSGVDAAELRAGTIVFETSRVDETKRKDLLLDAFAIVARERDDAYLFIGGGPENELLKSLVRRRDENSELRGRAFLTGFIPEEHMGPLFSIADVYATASEMEGFGISVLQAAAASTAVVCSDLVPFAVQYVPEEAAIVPAGDVSAFARAIGNLLDSPAERSARAERLSASVEALDWEAQTTLFVEFLRRRGREVAPAKRRP